MVAQPIEILPKLIQDSLPVDGIEVVREMLLHETRTRVDVTTSLEGTDLNGPPGDWLPAAYRSGRGRLVKGLLEFPQWRRCPVPPALVPSLTVYRGIHWRVDLAPATGTLEECAHTLCRTENFRAEFVWCKDAWADSRIDTNGLVAVLDNREAAIVEGCHRLVGLAWLMVSEPDRIPKTPIPIYFGLP